MVGAGGREMVILTCVCGGKTMKKMRLSGSKIFRLRLRRNYLRPKVLKSLRPIPTTFLPLPAEEHHPAPPSPTPTPYESQIQVLKELQPQPQPQPLKLGGAFAVAVFLFHTIFSAIWFILESSHQPQHATALPTHILESSQLDPQILLIREMARAARRTKPQTTTTTTTPKLANTSPQHHQPLTFHKNRPTRFNSHLPPPSPTPKGVNSTSTSTIKSKSNCSSKRSNPLPSGFDLWWFNLPYVLAIFLHRGFAPEGLGGLYTLKIPAPKQSQSDLSYTVAFEDRGDANNFCYILESFFEDLGDFSAQIVPFSAKELKDTVTSLTMRVIVLRKGQLQLYAGQPLADVEMALRSLIK